MFIGHAAIVIKIDGMPLDVVKLAKLHGACAETASRNVAIR